MSEYQVAGDEIRRDDLRTAKSVWDAVLPTAPGATFGAFLDKPLQAASMC